MLHARRQTLWIEDTTSYMPVQAAHNLAAMHYARESRLKFRDNGGRGADENGNDMYQTAREVSKWTTAHPMASVSSVLMQSVEPLEDYIANVTDLTPAPNRAGPSANEVRIVVARRRMLDRERSQQLHVSQENDRDAQDQLEQGGQGCSTPSKDVLTPLSATLREDRSREPRAKVAFLQDAVEIESSPGADAEGQAVTHATRPTAPAANEQVPEASQDSRLVLPVLESLVALRRSRLIRATPPSQQPQHQPYPPTRPPTMSMNGGGGGCGGGGSRSVAGESVWYGAVAPSAATKTAGVAKPNRGRFGTQTPMPTAVGVASSSSPQLPLGPTDQIEGSAIAGTAGRLQTMLSGPSGMQPPSLSQLPGSWRATRRWEVFLPEEHGSLAAAGTAAAASPNAFSRTASAAEGTARPTGPSPVASFAGNEASLERSAGAGGSSFISDGSKSRVVVVPPALPQAVAQSPASPSRQIGVSSDASTSGCRTSHYSPRTSIDLGLASSPDEGPEAEADSGGMARSVARQRALLREWREWRETGGVPPPGTDEETDCSGNGDDIADGFDNSNDEDDCGDGLLLGLNSVGRPAGGRSMPVPVAAAAARPTAAAAAEDDETYDEGLGKSWRRTRCITQSFDVLEFEGLADAASGPPAPLPVPFGRAIAGLALPAAAPPPLLAPSSGMASPAAGTSPIASPGLGPAPLSLMASRRRGDSSGRPSVGQPALPVWMNRPSGGGGGGGGGNTDAAAPAKDGARSEDGGRSSAYSASGSASPSASSTAATALRIPLLTSAKHLSFTSKFNRFKERIQSFSLQIQASLPADTHALERAASVMVGGGGGGSGAPVAGSNDGRYTVAAAADSSQFPARQPLVRKGWTGPACAATASMTDPQIRPTGRGSMDAAPIPKAQQQPQPQQQGAGAAAGSRLPSRHSLDSRLPASKGRSSIDAASTAAVAAAVQLSPPQGLQESLVITSSLDRSRRGDSMGSNPFASHSLPPVRLL